MQKEKEKFEKFCPNCGSTDLELYMGGHMGEIFQCWKCKYVGPVMERKVLRKEAKK